MRSAFKWLGIVLGGLAVLVILALAGVLISVNGRLNKTYTIQPAVITIPTDSASIEEGMRLASIYCAGCHGEGLAGNDFFSSQGIGVVDAPNLTAGSGGVGSQYTDIDWVRAIRHGVDDLGKPLFIMPSGDFYHLNDEDLGQIVAYIKSLPPVDGNFNDKSIGLPGRLLVALGAFGNVLHAETIDHTAPRPAALTADASAAYGEYLVTSFGCTTCHGAQLAGGKDPNPDAPPGPNLTRGGNLSSWTDADFINVIRARKSEWMPYESLSKMTDQELTAIFRYLQSLPALETK